MTLVGCYNTSKRLADCAHHELPSSTATSMDISISCGSDGVSNDDNSGDVESAGLSHELNSISLASLSVAIVCASAVIILVAVLIIMFIVKQKRKQNTIR